MIESASARKKRVSDHGLKSRGALALAVTVNGNDDHTRSRSSSRSRSRSRSRYLILSKPVNHNDQPPNLK